MATQLPAHTLRVRKLYRHALKNLFNWVVHREVFVAKGNDMRAEFEKNRHVTDARTIQRLVGEAEAKLAENIHPEPYIINTNFGGSKYMRYPRNGLGSPPEICELPPWIR